MSNRRNDVSGDVMKGGGRASLSSIQWLLVFSVKPNNAPDNEQILHAIEKKKVYHLKSEIDPSPIMLVKLHNTNDPKRVPVTEANSNSTSPKISFIPPLKIKISEKQFRYFHIKKLRSILELPTSIDNYWNDQNPSIWTLSQITDIESNILLRY